MLSEAVIEYCAPTLAGIKTGSLFTIRNSTDKIKEEICILNRMLTKKGLRIIPIRKTDKSTLIYLYRPERLKKDLCRQEAEAILAEKGYCCGNPEGCLVQLVKHLADDQEFPHEIGLFLGYPPSDVRSFMESPCKGVKCVGCWKVYSNQDEAEKTFNRFRKCTDIYRRKADSGKSLEELTVDEKCSAEPWDIAI